MSQRLTTHSNQYAIIYVNNANEGTIARYKLGLQNGDIHYLDSVNAGKNVAPLAISHDKKHLYAAVRSTPFKLVTFAITDLEGKLIKQTSAPLPVSMTYITTDQANKWLFAASYSDHLISVSSIHLDGAVIDNVAHRYPAPLHIHSIVVHPNNRFVYAASLGEDKILQYRLNKINGELQPIESGFIQAPKQSGARHMVISPDGNFLYVITEFTGVVCSYRINQDIGTLTPLNVTTGFPAEQYNLVPGQLGGTTEPFEKNGKYYAPIWGADIKITANGKFLYTSERSSNTVSCYQIDITTGKLSYVDTYLVEKQPRGIAIDPTGQYVIVSGQADDKVGVYKIEQQSGALTRVSEAFIGKNASWVETVIF